MSVTVDKILKTATEWIGKSDRTGTHKEIIDLYNTQKPLPRGYKVQYTDAWCATFVTAVFLKAGGADLIKPECSCGYMIEGLKRMNIFIENENYTPKKGDLVFFDWQDIGTGDNKGWADHVGIVESINGDKFTTIEGNINHAVGRKTYKINQLYLRGFATPNYRRKTNDELAREVITGLWGNGQHRKKALTDAGYDYKAVQAIVNKLLS